MDRPAAIEVMITAASAAGRKETGGILVGRYGPGMGRRCSGGHAQAQGVAGRLGMVSTLQPRAGRAFASALGGWPALPRRVALPPSCVAYAKSIGSRAMQAITRDESYRCPSPLLVILADPARTGNSRLRCSETVPPRHWVNAAGTLPAGGENERSSSCLKRDNLRMCLLMNAYFTLTLAKYAPAFF